MSSYGVFAEFYDSLTNNVDYKVRSDYISGFFTAENIDSGNVVDLGCGTGSVCLELAKKGYTVVGVDLSSDMLMVAQNKLAQVGKTARFINCPMQDYVEAESADAIVSLLDSINHLTDVNDVASTFYNVYKTLKSGGLFVFDVNTVYKHQNILAEHTFIFDEEDYYIVWDNEAVDDREIRILLDFFIYNGESYDRYSEEFNEKAYTVSELEKMLRDAGFDSVRVYDELTHNAPKENSERLFFVCKKV